MATIVPLISFGMHMSAQSAQKTSGFESLNSVSVPPPAKEAHAPVLKPAKNNDGLKSASDYTFSTKKVSAHAPVVPGSAPIYGCLLSNPYSIILLPTDGTTTTVTSVASDENLNANGGAVCNGTTYYSINYSTGWFSFTTIYKFNAETWEYSGLKNANTSEQSTDMAYDPLTEKIYGCFKDNSGTSYVFGTLDPEIVQRKAIKTLDEAWNACAVAKDGTLYAITMSGKLYTVDKNTGDMTPVGDTGVKPCYMASATIDHRSGRFYWTAAPETGNAGLYEVNPTTGEASLLYELPEGAIVNGLYIPTPEADDNAPAAPYLLKASFEKGSMSGIVSFDIPSVTFGGSALSNEVEYTVYVNGPESNTYNGTAMPGQSVSLPVTVGKAGDYEFTVRLSNQSGDSPKASVKAFVGNGTPAPVKITDLSVKNGMVSISWDASTAAVDGGYFNPEDVTYTVVRYPSGKTVSTGSSETSFSEKIESEDLTIHYYTITADCNGAMSAAVESSRFVTGYATVPYAENFDNQDALAAFTIIDANNDGSTWSYYESNVRNKYNTKNTADDWLLTPPVKLTKGWTYRFAFTAAAHNNSDDERIEVKFGNTPSADGMTTGLLSPTVISGKSPQTYECFASIAEDGVYYFGIHGISDPDKYYLYIDDISITQSYSNDVPDVPSEFTVAPYVNGELKADISLKAPDKAVSGEAISTIEHIIIARDGVTIKDFDNVQAGVPLSYTDASASQGVHTYEAYAITSKGEGKHAVKRVYIGVNVPSAPTSAHVVETETPGQVTISWKAPETDIEGNPLNPELVTYRIITQDDDDNVIPVADNLKGTSYTYQAIPTDGKQDFVVYAVHAKTTAGESEGYAKTEMILAGPDYVIPFHESFPGGHLGEYVFGINTINGTYARWALSDEMSQDDDGGCIGFIGSYRGDEATLYTGKISLRNSSHPVLVFHYFASSASTSTLKVLVDDFSGNGYKQVRTITMNESGNDGWTKVSVPLDEYKDKTVSIMFDATVGSHNAVVIDNINVLDRPQNDLIATAITAPEKVKAGTDLNVTVSIENFGAETATGYVVELYCNDVKIAQKDGEPLACDNAQTYTFAYPVAITSPEMLHFHAVVVYSSDSNPSDNKTASITTKVELPTYPRPTALKARTNNTDVILEWMAPDLSTTRAEAITEDFETYTPWATTGVGEWLLIDRDGCRTAGVVDEIRGQAISFFVFDSELSNKGSDYASHSGKRMMASAYLIDEKGTKCDDWMISPLLPGYEQTIKLYARSQKANYPETFEVLYSTGSTEPENFILLETFKDISGEWTEYTVELPDGAERFAVHGISDDCYLLLVDDICFIPASAKPEELNLTGYNIYRNGVQINSAPVQSTMYTDSNVPGGIHSYVVSAVYDKGESAPSESVSAETSGIDTAPNSQTSIIVSGQNIVINNADNLSVEVHTTDGKTIVRTLGSTQTIIPVSTGIYIVRAGATVQKVVVK